MSPLSQVWTHWAVSRPRPSLRAAATGGGVTAAARRHGVLTWTNQRRGNRRRALIGRDTDGAERWSGSASLTSHGEQLKQETRENWRGSITSQCGDTGGTTFREKQGSGDLELTRSVCQAGANLMKSENENSVRPIIIIISSIMMNKNYTEPYKGQIPADTLHCSRRWQQKLWCFPRKSLPPVSSLTLIVT